jgi:ketosteroid isomerase-like protein
MRASFETARLSLSLAGEADRENLVALERDPEVMRFLNGGRATPEPTSSNWSLAHIQEELMVTEDYVREVFKGLEHGDGAGFFEHVDDRVDWIVEGTHPLAGHYKSKSDFVAGTFAKLGKVLPNGAQLVVEHLLVKDDQAVVELHSLGTAKNGFRFDNRYCWVVHFDGDTIDRVRAYLDSTMVARLFEENPI